MISNCGCIKKREFDIRLYHKGCDMLVLEDKSLWEGTIPEEYTISLKISSRNITKELVLKTNFQNVFTTKEIYGTESINKINDDIFCITTESCGYLLTINRASLCGFKTKLMGLISKYAFDLNDVEKRNMINNLDNQIKAIEINAEMGNLKIAEELYSLTKEEFDKHFCNNC